MDADVAKSKRYRERAEEIRTIADGIPEGNMKRILLGVALEYEQFARALDGANIHGAPDSAAAALKKPDRSG